LYKEYKDKDLVAPGFASGDFDQEADSDKDIATVCFINYGVTFGMFSPLHVKREDAHRCSKSLPGKVRNRPGISTSIDK
jgi:glutathione peroxidase